MVGTRPGRGVNARFSVARLLGVAVRGMGGSEAVLYA